jgi:outer membrane protein assembly factor BamA
LLDENEYLYAGAKVKVHADKSVSGKSIVEGMLKDETYPMPNRRIFGLPYKLWISSVFASKKKKDKNFISTTYGERPVLLTDVPVEEVSQSLHTVLKANGFLDSRVKHEIIKTRLGKKQRKVLYHCYVEAPYLLRNITVDIDDSLIKHLIDSVNEETMLHPNDRYNLNKLIDERERIDELLKTHGFYYFSPEYLIFKADSMRNTRQIDLSLQLKPGIDPKNHQQWFVNEIFVLDNSVKDSLTISDTVKYKGITFLTGKLLKPKYFRHFILFTEGGLLASDNYSITNKNLSKLAVFRYANMDAIPDTTSKSNSRNTVDINIDLTPNSLHNFRASAELVSKSNDFAGPGVELAYTNRNLFGGGEQLIVKTNGSAEAWLSKSGKDVVGNFNYELGASAELRFPRFLLLKPSVISSRFIPDNIIRLESQYINQMQFYRMSFFRMLYGYRWAETVTRNHELNLIDITYQHMLKSTNVFDSLINVNPLLEQSFSDQFIVGTNYTYRYAIPDDDPRPVKTAFTGSLDLSGNLLYGIQSLAGKKGTSEEPLKFIGTTYAQYVKTTLDYRIYMDVSRKNRLATRLSAGLGLPVGNSGTLPGIKQYYLGGANSLRAFKFRSVGPGAFADSLNTVLINHSGEIMLLGNLENRYKFARSFEWAVFLDAGNIWLVKDDPLRTGARFNSRTFLKQIAIGWGTGLRYINQYFIIRIDVGFPLRSPNLVQKASDMKSVWNFAIGYPF